jgi:hypothetical protein
MTRDDAPAVVRRFEDDYAAALNRRDAAALLVRRGRRWQLAANHVAEPSLSPTRGRRETEQRNLSIFVIVLDDYQYDRYR